MKTVEFIYEVKTSVTFTRPELDLMIKCSREHYDGHCRNVSQQGGFLYGMNNVLTWAEEDGGKTEADVELTHDQLDTLCKVTERISCVKTPEEVALHDNLVELLRENGREYKRLNKME